MGQKNHRPFQRRPKLFPQTESTLVRNGAALKLFHTGPRTTDSSAKRHSARLRWQGLPHKQGDGGGLTEWNCDVPPSLSATGLSMASCEGADLPTGVAKLPCAPFPIKPPLETSPFEGAGPVAPLPIVNPWKACEVRHPSIFQLASQSTSQRERDIRRSRQKTWKG